MHTIACLLFASVIPAVSAAAQVLEQIGAPFPGVSAYDPDRARLVHVSWDRRVHEWQNGTWFQKPNSVPVVNAMDTIATTCLVHDPAQHRMLLLADGPTRALFAFDGENWTSLPVPALPFPYGYQSALAFDSLRQRLVLVLHQTTFELVGQTWTQTVAATPLLDTLAYDPVQQRLMGYGASGGGLGQVSTYDGVAWTSTTAGVPPYRGAASLAFDPVANVMVLHGSPHYVVPDRDDWEWNGAQWTQLVGTGTTEQSDASLATTPQGLLRVDQGTRRQVSVRVLQAWLPLGAAGPSYSAAIRVADPVHGGIHGLDFDLAGTRFHRLDNRDWVETGSAPSQVTEMAFDPLRQLLVGMTFGPTGIPGEWTWNGTAWSFTPFSGTVPPFRYGSACAFDAARGEFLVFGGSTPASIRTNDLWAYRNRIWTLHPGTPAPTPRESASMVYDPLNQRILLFGGWPALDDTWSWNGTTWQQLSPTHAPFAGPSALLFDSVTQQPLAFHRIDRHTLGVSAHDGTNWNLLNQHALPAPFHHLGSIAAIEPGTGRLVISYDGFMAQMTQHLPRVDLQGQACGQRLQISARTFAHVGEPDAGIDVHGQPGGALLGLSLQSANVPLGGGCTLLLGSLDLALVLGVNAAGFGSQILPVPNTPALAGITVFAQAAQLDALSPIGIAVSAQLALTIGD